MEFDGYSLAFTVSSEDFAYAAAALRTWVSRGHLTALQPACLQGEDGIAVWDAERISEYSLCVENTSNAFWPTMGAASLWHVRANLPGALTS